MKKKFYRIASLFVAINLIVEIFFPAVSYALTSGPTQPEHVQFAPIGADNSVDLFSGDFSYNIPLFSLPGPDGGYPFNLTYQAGVGMEEEASWVGLGWNLTPGAINRQMRGLPDEFKGDGENPDKVRQELKKRPNSTTSITLGAELRKELFGQENKPDPKIKMSGQRGQNGALTFGLAATFKDNTYTGVGFNFAPSISYSLPTVSENLSDAIGGGLGMNAKLSGSLDSDTGADSDLGVGGSIGFEGNAQNGDKKVSRMGNTTKTTTPKSYLTGGLNFGINLSYNSRLGMTGVSFNAGLQGGKRFTERVFTSTKFEPTLTYPLGRRELGDIEEYQKGVNGNIGSGWSMSFANNGQMPSIGIPMKVNTVSRLLKVGVSKGVAGYYFSPYVGYTYMEQVVRDEDRYVSAYGYNHTEKNNKNDGIMDFNRENDGMVYPNTKTLPSPHFTYDTYMVTGQGMLGSFRPYRSEIVTLGDRKERSVTSKASFGADLDAYLKHWGANFDGITGSSTSERMSLPKYDYKTATSKNTTYEPVFYKFQGEAAVLSKNALKNIGGNVPLRFDVNTKGKPKKLVYSTALSKLEEAEATKSDSESLDAAQEATENTTALEGTTATLNKILYPQRAARNRVIIPMENQYAEALPEYTVHYKDDNEEVEVEDGEEIPEYRVLDRTYEEYDPQNPQKPYKKHHLAGFTCTSTDGLRYVYGLPVYNFEQAEHVQSVNDIFDVDENYTASHFNGRNYVSSYSAGGNGTEKFKSTITTPSYASSYLLTSILGNNYIDVDTEINPGPSKADLGYWVKFYYERHSNNYEWRMPYRGANFTEGLLNSNIDDKVSYIQGKKELMYLNKVESKTHIAIFRTENREDARGVNGQSQKSLDRIDIYTRIEYENSLNPVPLKSIHFKYEYNLCYDTDNSVSTGRAKLTLKQLYFTYQNKERGGINPYEFEYHGEGDTDLRYDRGAKDPWGTYIPPVQTELNNVDFPYTRQDVSKAERDRYAAAWSLSKITFPSGSTMNIFYESDDYSHVQDRKAMQMTKFEINLDSDDLGNKKKLFTERDNLAQNRIIYFPLNSIHLGKDVGSLDERSQAKIANEYLDERDQVYFKARIALRYNSSENKGKDYEDVEAYLDLEPTSGGNRDADYTRGLFSENGTTYTHGFFTVEETRQKGVAYHPLSAAAWIKLKSEHPRLLNSSNEMDELNDVANGIKKAMKAMRTAASISEAFTSYFKAARRRSWGRYIDPKYSLIRLNNVTGNKYGGGIRVKRIEFSQNGERTAENTYGQVYDYTTIEDGKTISSGVASFEPMGAAEENPLRYVEKFEVKVPALPNYPMFSQFPANEGYYPSAQVGYRKVTVKSIATAAKIQQAQGDNNSEYEGLAFPTGISTTGITVQEFYTYKDFPILSSHSNVDYEDDQGYGIGFGLKTTSYTGASQGYVIELNNMNGTPKSMYHYGQNDKGEVQYDKPISSSQYFYKTTRRQGKNAVDNLCSTLVKERDGKILKEDKLVGVEYEVFMDSRQSITSTKQYGVNANLDFIKEPFNLPFTVGFGGMLKEMREEVRTVVVNKIIYRSGILDSVRVSDGLSVSTTRNLLWDQNTGAVLLTSVNNNFDDRIYSYTIPAYTQYDEMGAAYRNIGLRFKTGISPSSGGRIYNATTRLPKGYSWARELVVGDELVVRKSDEEDAQVHRAIYMGVNKETANLQFYIVPIEGLENPEGNLEFMVYRSGRRNLLGVSAGSITSLSDPTQEYNRDKKIFSGKSNIKKQKNND